MTTANIGQASPETGPWEAALEQLRDWDPAWAETCTRMATNPWRSESERV